MSIRSFPNDWPPSNGVDRPHVEQPTDSEVIELAWCDDTTFDSIKLQTGLSEKDVIKLMRSQMKQNSFKLWRKRVSGRAAKHAAKSDKQRFTPR